MTTISEALAIALEHHQAGRLAAAEQHYRQILQVAPDHADSLHLLGLVSHQTGQSSVAIEYIRQAIALNPNDDRYHMNLGSVYLDGGQLAEAMVSLREALRLKPDNAPAYYNLATALRRSGRLAEAIESCHQAILLDPGYAEAHNNLGAALQEQGRLAEAQAEIEQALRLNPNLADGYHNLGNVLRLQGRFDEALRHCQDAVRLRPHSAEAYDNLGATLLELGRRAEAQVQFEQAVRLNPKFAAAHSHLGNTLRDQGQVDEASDCYRRALELEPNLVEALDNLGGAFKDGGKLHEAIACYRRAMQINPNYVAGHSNLVYTLNFGPDDDAKTIYEEHRRWNQQHAEPLAKLIQPHVNERSADRRLRIGYVSPDFRNHVVGLFMLPLLEAHDHDRYEIHCYSSVRAPDAITDRCRDHADQWRSVFGVSDEQLAQTIRQDRIDILVDLTMHMGNNRLLVFARKPAPVQVTYLAYPGTTGLSTIDYRLTDVYLDPPGQHELISSEPVYSEASIRLPDTYWCYRPLIETPAVNGLPAFNTGHITFGCLNNFCKVTEPTLRAWICLLQAIPTARLLLHAGSSRHRDRVGGLFAQHGISPERVTFAGPLPMAEYFRLYHQIDVALDPFPYGGGTTTCDALWMGVPVISLAGKTAVGRAGLSILSNVGVADLVASDREQYVRIALELARDLQRLSQLRARLREHMQASPLMDAPRFAHNVEAAYRDMWRRWCES